MKIVTQVKNSKQLAFYEMKLNLERAKKFREEYSKKIQFFKMEYGSQACALGCYQNNDVYNLYSSLEEDYERKEKVVYALEKIPKKNQNVFYGSYPTMDATSYTLFPYWEEAHCTGSLEQSFKEGKKERENFLSQFIENGFLNYRLASFKGTNKEKWQGYIFLNKMAPNDLHGTTNNVVLLPDELFALILIEKEMYEETENCIYRLGRTYEEIEKIKSQIYENFDFELSSILEEKNREDLIACGLLDKDLRRKLNKYGYIPLKTQK